MPLTGLVADGFVRANNTNISTGAPFSWTEVVGDVEILSNQLHCVSANGSLAPSARVEVDEPSANHECSVTIGLLTLHAATQCDIGACVRFASAATTFYSATLDHTGTGVGNFVIQKCVAGTFTNLTTGPTINGTSGDVMRLTVAGSTLTSYYNGVQQEQITDSSITTGTRIGVVFFRAAATVDVAISNINDGGATPAPLTFPTAVHRAANW